MWFVLCLLRLALPSTESYSQTSASSGDSVCYSAEENEGITSALLELQQLRTELAPLYQAAGYYASYKERVNAIVTKYVDKRSFLGIGLRRRKKAMQKEINELP